MSKTRTHLTSEDSKLSADNRAQRRQALRDCAPGAVWTRRKERELTDVLEMSQRAGPSRLRILSVEAAEALRALIHLKVPVPCLHPAESVLEVAGEALVGLAYPREAITGPLPGTSFVQIIRPAGVWLPQVSMSGQVLCLGPSLPAGVRLTDLILMTYGALSMQLFQLDELDPAGVLNPEAAAWWQRHRERIPLSREPFFPT